MDEKIEGIVSSIVFSNVENGYTVIRLDTTEGLVTAAGSTPGISLGEKIVVTGSWTTHHQYGEQFKVESYEVFSPSGEEEIFRFLSTGSVKGIGPAKARDIVDKFGTNALNIIENDPDLLSTIKGISLRSARSIGDSYRRRAGLRRLVLFLSQYNIKPLIATRVYKDYGDDSVDAVCDNPYLLVSENYGADFFEADTIALDLGFESNSPPRISAALIYELVHNLGNGHTFIPKNKLTEAVNTLIGINHDEIVVALDTLCEYGDIVVEQVANVVGCYLKHIYEAEEYLAKRILEMVNIRQEISQVKIIDKIQKNIEKTSSILYSTTQKEAICLAAENNILVLTGGPGTGKTTTVRGILEMFDVQGLKTVLCAPTGRAAKRLSELTGREALTIHRLLGAGHDDSGIPIFERDELNQLEADVIIVDECSMIDILLMYALLKALKPGGRLIMVGDTDQLPPVGPGNMFSDVIRSEVVPTIALTEIFRQSEDSGIIKCAHEINNGNMPDFTEKFSDLFFMRRNSEEHIAQTIAELYSERLPNNMGVDPSLIQVLSSTRKRGAGTVNLNMLLREKLNPQNMQKNEKQFGDYLFRTGDKVMQIKNNYDIIWQSSDKKTAGTGMFNGDVGIVLEVDHNREAIIVDFEDKLVTYTFDQLHELEPAFAMTVHKSQGSEYHAVILAMTPAAPQLLTRSVLYTAVTRAKSLLVIVGNAEVMQHMVANDKRQKRYSGLRVRLVKS
ncbi:MAG: ATP-dependent RecD-like DNA helicase [Oscillospiraceae bacterium]|nr:ATP-dependent RecD-like DNA helicase [Oscillospiraceae bacterium]